ncbi:MAG TPA: FAD-binding oxidoreductase [Streptosporangiaceae bacterium]
MNPDIVVIGAGALGLSTALHCALKGRTVVVVERDAPGSQASGRAAGLFKSVQADELRTALARRSITRAVSFSDWARVPLEVARSGSFLVARTDEHQAHLRVEAGRSRGWGADVTEAGPGELSRRVSYYHGDGRELALWCPEDVYIEEPTHLVRALAAACRRHGVELLESEAVTEISLRGGQVTGLRTARRSMTATTVVDAAGAWTRQVAELARESHAAPSHAAPSRAAPGRAAGPAVAVAPVRHQLLITEPAAGLKGVQPIVRVVDAAVYLRPARGGLMLGGFEADPLPVDPRSQPATFRTDDLPLDLGVLRKMGALVAAQVPLAGELAVAEHRGGMFTMTPDGRFIAGPVPDVPGLWVASGCNGSGFSSSLAIGEALAGWITDMPGRLDISALSPARFGPLTDEALITDGVWQYAHYYDPA